MKTFTIKLLQWIPIVGLILTGYLVYRNDDRCVVFNSIGAMLTHVFIHSVAIGLLVIDYVLRVS